MRALILIAAGLALAACSRDSGDQTKRDLSASGKDLAGVAHQVASSPDWAKAREDLKRLGHDVGQEARKGAHEADVEAHKGAAQAKVETHKAAADARSGAHKLAANGRHATHEAHRRADRNG